MFRDFSPLDSGDIWRSIAGSGGRRLASLDGHRELTRPVGPSPSPEPRPERSQENAPRFTHGWVLLQERDRGYRLSESQIRAMDELGRFRVIADYDLTRHAYLGRQGQAEADIQDLVRKGLARKGTFEGPEGIPRQVLTLTERGLRLLRANRLVSPDQAVYCGFGKPKQTNHDADLYLLYQKEASRIEAAGGRNLRVILDYDLTRRVNRDLARLGTTAREQIAHRHGLRVVDNKIPIPDMRIEYQTQDAQSARVDLELVTEHYRGPRVAEKVRAGFSLYVPHGEANHLRRVLDRRELTAPVQSL